MDSTKSNLVVVSHPDDEILGFGGTGSMLAALGETVIPVILCGEVKERTGRPGDKALRDDIIAANRHLGFCVPELGHFPNIRMNTVDHVDIVQYIEEKIERYQPTRIFTHHPGDLNDDHVKTAKACMVAARLFQRRSSVRPLSAIYYMEILSSTDWSFPAMSNLFIPDTYSDITSKLDQKLEALSLYSGVMRPAPHPRSEQVIRGHAAFRGGQCGHLYAEAFQTAFRREV
jgi:LmbE family N-acetylglucosaminyl deacetylase